jgi:hypothetical protein
MSALAALTGCAIEAGVTAIVLAAQAALPTVGDTIWLRRSLRIPAGYVVRPAEWQPSDPIEAIGRPRVEASGDSVEISYPVVVWQPGQHVVELPGPLLLGPGGTVDSLAGMRLQVHVRSVLPVLAGDSLPDPQPRASLVARSEQTLGPLFVLWGVSLMLLLPLHLWWRRRGKPAPTPVTLTAPPEIPLARWADAGEYRALVHVSSTELRAAVAQRVTAAHSGLDTRRLLDELSSARPDWPLQELSRLLTALDEARFGLRPGVDALELSRATLQLRDRLLREAA